MPNARPLLLLVAFLPATDGFSQTKPLYLEENGILAIEAENATNLPSQWRVETSVSGASGGAYLRALQNNFGTPARGTIGYDFRTSRSAPFQFAFNSRIGQGNSSTDHNDAWVRLVDDRGVGVPPIPNQNDTRSGQWHKIYMNTFGRWDHQASNVDNVGRSLSWNLLEDREYSLQISSRSAGHLIDRLYLWDKHAYNLANEERGWGPNNGAFGNLVNSAVFVPEPGSLALGLLCTLAALPSRRVN